MKREKKRECKKRERVRKRVEEEAKKIVVYCIDCSVWYKLCEIVRIIKCLSYLLMVVVLHICS